jgi:integrase/recombinase XerD
MKNEKLKMKNDFYDYRLQKGYSTRTIKSQDSYIRRFNKWLTQSEINLQSIGYQTVLSFVSDERKKGTAPGNLRNRLQAIRVYLDYQITTGILNDNPAANVKLQDRQHKSLLPAIGEETLQTIYKTFTIEEPKNEYGKLLHQRDSVVLGLLIFQGLDSGDLERLTVKDISLTDGTVYIASSRKNAARTLKLESLQILSIHQYLTQTRNHLNENQIKTEQFFIKSKINDMVSAIITKLKTDYPEIQNPRHIRSSVIMNWLKKYHIRQVQYMAGHKRVCSTERYRREDLHDLTLQLQKYHPIK